jgi:hypothetical protein
MVDGDTVLVTLLGSDRVADAAARDRFTAEARVARRVAPFCVARILDAGVEGGDAYLVAEYVPPWTRPSAAGGRTVPTASSRWSPGPPARSP